MTNPAVIGHCKFCRCRNVILVIGHYKNCHRFTGKSSVIEKSAAGIGRHQSLKNLPQA
jgi:hypothetical protein